MKSLLMSFVLILAASLAACNSAGEDVRFRNADVTLAGTLLRPPSQEPVPAVVLIHGSGETDRNSLRYYAEMFVRQGVAALVYDKRGVGESQGDAEAWRSFSFDDLAGDAAAAIAYLATRQDIDAERIGLFGASQGGWVAPLAALESQRVAFMVLLSASVTTVAEDRLFERAARLKIEGFSESEIHEVTDMQLVDQELTRSGQGFERFAELWNQNQEKRWFRRVYLGEEPTPADSQWRQWYRTVLDFDPMPILQQLTLPVLWLFGDPALDRFGPVQASLDQLEALKRSGKPYRTEVFLGTDHNLQRVEGDDPVPLETTLEQWLSDVVLQD